MGGGREPGPHGGRRVKTADILRPFLSNDYRTETIITIFEKEVHINGGKDR